MLIFYILLFVIFFIIFFSPTIENLEVQDIAATKTDPKTDECSCDQIKSLSNLVSQYNILNNEIKKNMEKISQNTTDITQIQTLTAQNKAAITKINGLMKQLKEAATEKQ